MTSLFDAFLFSISILVQHKKEEEYFHFKLVKSKLKLDLICDCIKIEHIDHEMIMPNSVSTDQTVPGGAVWSGFSLFSFPSIFIHLESC